MPSPSVAISLSSFGADSVRNLGQVSYLPLLAASGARRVEWREELFNKLPEPAELAQAAADHGLEQLYSAPLGLWRADGQLEPAVMERLQLAREIGAVALKVSLGHWQPGLNLCALHPLFEQGPALYIENDQTVEGGRLPILLNFFEAATSQGVAPGMTFDVGNWHWQQQSPLQAAQQLGPWVRYVHCKAVQRRADGRLQALPPQDTDLEQWRELLRYFEPNVPRAIEFPLIANDLPGLTRRHVAQLAQLEAQVRHA
ncbi:sugar phosphate isomerase/epimerase family protein [Pseudomonas sp. 5P_3.1_Bac2]|uniref:sugar phosphate isomerase/epimerase family protein n=1 Tax=Pseudomonas sp. 5P_3.1_Bac2 TaxID=2971617 RepID=UPI0021C5A536|nr:AP endonuclease [Pseudomonas sp. 5P_3.1_Bac2]MCU1715746.1 AP endonuclease [Pseudomonas sp. 5P_3.1_Bac2]